MKLSVAIATESAPPSAFVVWRGIEQSIRKAAEYNFSGIELALKDAHEISAESLDHSLRDSGLEVSCISTGQVFATTGLYFTHPDESARKRLKKTFTELIDLAADYGRLVNIGRVRGYYIENEPKSVTEDRFIETTTELCEYAQKKDVTLIIEPVNRYEINFLNSVNEAADLCKRIGAENLGLMPDTFHMNIEDESIALTLYEHRDLVKYIHFADSNRLTPGRGNINFSEIVSSLNRANYDGWISLEILPEPVPDIAAKEAADFILPLLQRYNVSVPA